MLPHNSVKKILNFCIDHKAEILFKFEPMSPGSLYCELTFNWPAHGDSFKYVILFDLWGMNSDKEIEEKFDKTIKEVYDKVALGKVKEFQK